jgi:membrane-associated HD superfamily phosphohydrolase
VDHQAQEVNQAKMAATEPTAKMVKKEAQAKMPAKKKNCCQFHPNANVEPNLVHLAQLVQKEPMVHPEMLVAQEEMVNPDPKVHLVPLAQLAPLVMLALMVLKEKMVNWAQDPKVQLVLLVPPAKLVQLVPLAKLVNPAKMVPLVPLVVLVMLALLVVQAKLAVLVALESPARTALLAAANTAHLLVWLQVIKRWRLSSQAMRQTWRLLGRLFNDDQKHHFVYNHGLFTAFFPILIPSFM